MRGLETAGFLLGIFLGLLVAVKLLAYHHSVGESFVIVMLAAVGGFLGGNFGATLSLFIDK